MKTTLRGLLVATTALCALASPAFAQTQTGLAVKDGAGTSQTLCTYTISSNQVSCSAQYVWNGSAWVLVPTGTGTATNAPRTVVAQDSSTVAGSSSLPAGSNTIGSIANTSFGISGTLPAFAATPAVKEQDSAGGDATDATNHAILVEPQTNGRLAQGGPVSITTTSLTTLLTAQGAGLYSYVTDLDCANTGSYTFTLTITNSGPTQLYQFAVPAGGGWVKSFATPLAGNGQMTANTALSIQASGGTGNPSIVCNVQGKKSAN